MKKILLTLTLAVASVAAFAQGKASMGNDANHLLVYSSAVSSNTPALAARAGLAVGQVGTANNGFTPLTLELLGGTSAGSLTLRTTLVGDLIGQSGFADGRIANVTLSSTVMAGLPSGSPAWFQLVFYSTAAGSFSAAQQDAVGQRWYFGSTPVFSITPGSITPTPFTSSANWPAAPIVLQTTAVIPEPSSMALAGLGAASLLIFRRRK